MQAQATPPQLANHRVKIKQPLQRVCNEANAQGKLCAGHLKRWFYESDVKEQACGDVLRALGRGAEVYRCEHCKTLYLPDTSEPRRNVAGTGSISDFGLTIPPKKPEGTAAAEPGTAKG